MTTLLIDADIVAYKAAARNQQTYKFESGDCHHIDEEQAKRDVDAVIGEYCDILKSNTVIVCLTDPAVNFRKQLCDSYKSNRSKTEKPQLLNYIKGYLSETYDCYLRERLEADDVMGILATHPTLINDHTIIVSEDKDMRTIPADVYHPHRPENGVMHISELDAHRFHMYQVIVGDPTDGYGGCPGVGKASVYAEEVLGADQDELWDIVLDAYASKGLGEEAAILQARFARILHARDYNFKTKKIRLWTPECLD